MLTPLTEEEAEAPESSSRVAPSPDAEGASPPLSLGHAHGAPRDDRLSLGELRGRPHSHMLQVQGDLQMDGGVIIQGAVWEAPPWAPELRGQHRQHRTPARLPHSRGRRPCCLRLPHC